MFVYIHIPFCKNICTYCDFCKVLYNKKYIVKYLKCLEEEIRLRYKGELVRSIFIGGGTPNSLEYDELVMLFEIVNIFNRVQDIEFSIEVNVECLDYDKIKLFKKYGVNRISLGIESFDEDILRDLNRSHNIRDVRSKISMLKRCGFSNISIDLIYGISADMDILIRDIDYFLELGIPHLSIYSLIIEDNTIFGINKREYIDEDIEYQMYKYIEDKMRDNGYCHYEVSNYAKDGYMSIHNLNYWDNGEYYGFGLGSVSYIDNYRISNTRNLTNYLNGIYIKDKIYEDEEIRISNALILGFRKVKGIDIDLFNKKYKVNILDLYNIRDLIEENKLIIDKNYLSINLKYFYNMNEILINFLTEK